jgi:hypothetical protein
MLKPETTVQWARLLVGWVNLDINTNRVGAEFTGSLHPQVRVPLPFKKTPSLAKDEELRALTEDKLRWLIKQQQPTGRDPNGGPRWVVPADQVARIRCKAAEWLWNAGIVTSGHLGMLNLRARTWQDESGRIGIENLAPESLGDFVAITLAEIASPDTLTQVLQCAQDGCERLFVRDLKLRSRPQLYCSKKHAAAARMKKHRDKKRETER